VRSGPAFPQEVVTDVPRVTLTGDSEAHVSSSTAVSLSAVGCCVTHRDRACEDTGAGLRFRQYTVAKRS
jgi:hypothetical protein